MMTAVAAEREIVVTRTIDAPREFVFSTFTEQEHTEKWWAPEGSTTHEWNAKPGGSWRYSQPGPDGSEYPFKITFIEITRPSRLVYDFETDTDNAPEAVRTQVNFDELNGKTRITLRLQFVSVGAREEAANYGAAAGAQMALKNLADYLAGS